MYSAAISTPRCPVPRPSSKSLARNFTWARIFSLSISGRVACGAGAFPGAAVGLRCAAAYSTLVRTHANASTADRPTTACFFIAAPCEEKELLLGTILQKVLQFAHELLHVFEVHIHRCESHIRHFVQLLQPVHDHFADFGGGQFALRSLMDHALDLIHDRFQFRGGHRPLLASLQQPLQNLLALEALPPPVFLDHHVRNFVNALVGGEPPPAFQALPPAANHVPGAAF